MSKKEECVRVVVRCRPMSSKERADNRQKVVEMDKTRGQARARRWLSRRPLRHRPSSPSARSATPQVTLHSPVAGGEPPKNFTFDQVYDENTQQEVCGGQPSPC